MRTINPSIENVYSCFECKDDFTSQKVLSFFWFCNDTCENKFALGIVRESFPNASFQNQILLSQFLRRMF